MEKCEEKIMSVKNELDSFFDRFLKKYQQTSSGLPMCPRNKNINQTIYVGESGTDGWCKWKPVPCFQTKDFICLLDKYGIERNINIIEYFTSYYFLVMHIQFKKHLIGINAVESKDDYKGLQRRIDSYVDQNGKITHISLGIEERTGYTVVVEVKTGIVKYVDDDKGKMRKIASSLEEFIKGWEPVV